jgi:hypothetical protein
VIEKKHLRKIKKIPSTKKQITNKSQCPKFKTKDPSTVVPNGIMNFNAGQRDAPQPW